jgi:hypothetical protein
VTIIQTILVFVVAPAALYGLIALFVFVPGRSKRRARYRPGQPWEHPPQWWAGDEPVVASGTVTSGATRGGARGSW